MQYNTPCLGHGFAKAGPCLVALVVLLALLGCDRAQQPRPEQSNDDIELTEQERKEQALQAVDNFYDAAARGDCDKVMKLVPKFQSVDECKHFSERFAGNGLRFIGPKEVRIDGRDPRAVIIKAKTMRRGKSDEMNLRAELENDRWIIVF